MPITLWWNTSGIQLTDDGKIKEVRRSQQEAIEDAIPHYRKIEAEKKARIKQERQINTIYVNFGKFVIGFLIGYPLFSLLIHFIMKVV